ncbi:PREDICTED: neuropeptide-like 3 [Ceratosolen solmsi marchali]|uniref:Neuropeptide-like 3 n=1 Tax=Ceratosolen solmsi marchali TaxID=326594 RepID=A0AAJ6YTB0_9HYME|nr:PREDICTED: neuropeptide-like 3 [Ceratosolen solmsi marchali]
MFKLFLLAAILTLSAASPAPVAAPAPEPKPGSILAAPAYSPSYIAPAPAIAYNAYTPLTYSYGGYALPYYRTGYLL